MIQIAKIYLPALAAGIIFINGCSNNTPSETSAFEKTLNQPPYATLTDSIKAAGNNAELYFKRGTLLYTNKMADAAMADLKKAWSIDKKEEYAFSISNILLEKRPDSATAFINKALTILPNSVFLELNLGESLAAQNKPDEALKVYDDLLLKYPGQIDAWIKKADLLAQKNDLPGSTAALEKAYSLAPQDMELTGNLAFNYAKTKNPKALALADTIIALDKKGLSAEPYYFKGVYYDNINDKNKALEQFDLAIQKDYNFLDAYMEKGRILYERKKTAEALKVFQLSTTISPAFADGYLWLAKCKEALNQKEEALADYQRAFGFDKTLIEAKEGIERLK
jgi:tetratricopeptide (TPR) repeat protein